MIAIVLYLALGAFAGILAGLLGVGGGLVIVPLISYAFVFQGITSPHAHLMALGTSLATIMFTSVSSLMAHHKNGMVIWDIVKSITPGILIGTFVGSKVATVMPVFYLKAFFILFLCYVGTQMLLNFKPKASRHMPGFLGNSLTGGVIGLVSSQVGIGGGTLSVPYMTWCNTPVHKAIGTSAAIGFPIALAGASGYLLNGLNIPDRPDYSLGYIYLPGLFGIAAASFATAPLGARLSHRLPVTRLKRCFACLLFAMAAQMFYKLLTATVNAV